MLKIDSKQKYFAHITEDGRKQLLADHLNNVAEKAADYAKASGLQATSYIAGLLHDLGKGCPDFQEYLAKSIKGEWTATAFPHSRGGARFILDIGENSSAKFAKYTAELIATVILSHHSSHDFVDDGNNIEHHQGWYMDRILYMDEMQYNEITDFANRVIPEDFPKLFEKACGEIETAVKHSIEIICASGADKKTSAEEVAFTIGMLMRTVLSCVIKADHKDTASFANNRSSKRKMHSDFEGALNTLKSRFKNAEPTPINACRQNISDSCGEFGSLHQAGIYTLEVPTGSGKTMATQRLALECMVKFRKTRIINVMPMLSIIEQNAQDIRNVMGKFCEVQEFHSDIIVDDMSVEQRVRYRDVADTWDAPVIITTLVQFLETCFKTRSRNIKRFAALQNAVILIDEAQSVPPNMLSLFNSAINYLSETCHCLVILCTATQPNLQMLRHPIHIPNDPSVVKYSDSIWSVFKRTNLIPISKPMTMNGLADFAKRVLKNNLLIICNTRSETHRLYKRLKNIPDCECIKIDTNLCPAHRKRVIKAMRQKLDTNQRLICISTQVIEAGVDLSFEAGIRVMAGLENAIQGSGRVNRHGEKKQICPVWIVILKNERLSNLMEISEGKMAMMNYLSSLSSLEEADLTSPDSIREYYRRKYLNTDIDPDYMTASKQSIYDMLSLNSFNYMFIQGAVDKHVMRYAFKSAGENFNVFDDESIAVVVPYGRGEELITELNSEAASNPYILSKMLKEAEQYSVKIFDYQREKLEKAGLIYSIADGKIMAVAPNAYDAVEGLQTDAISASASVYIV